MRRTAIIGAGPSGFYAADMLLKAGFAVDLFDRLPTPFGLVRAGVAPDHPKIKTVTRVYDKTAGHPAFRFLGGLELGRDITREQLLERYHAVVYAYGTAEGNRLGIPGEDLEGSAAATDFVGWYNGHPDFCDHAFDLTTERAVVVGAGNVALDVARMLVLAADELGATDTADHAVDAFGASGVKEVVVLARRGPAEAAFTTPELRELADLSRADIVVEPFEIDLPDDAPTTTRRNLEVLQRYAQTPPAGRSHRITFRFCASPVEVLGTDGRVSGLRIVRNRLERDAGGGRVRAVPTGEEEVLPCGLVLRAVGYRGSPVPGVPFDERLGRIPNVGGRVCGPDGAPLKGEYAVGWIKRGPSGVIGTNKKDAAETIAHLVADELDEPPLGATEDWLPPHVTWEGWESIDAAETRAGAPHGRPRVKLVRLEDLVRAAGPSSSS